MMKKIKLEEIIGCSSYYDLCDIEYDTITNDDYPSGIIHVHMDHIAEFFNKIKGNGRKYIVVSSRSDYGVCYQQDFLNLISCYHYGLR